MWVGPGVANIHKYFCNTDTTQVSTSATPELFLTLNLQILKCANFYFLSNRRQISRILVHFSAIGNLSTRLPNCGSRFVFYWTKMCNLQITIFNFASLSTLPNHLQGDTGHWGAQKRALRVGVRLTSQFRVTCRLDLSTKHVVWMLSPPTKKLVRNWSNK